MALVHIQPGKPMQNEYGFTNYLGRKNWGRSTTLKMCTISHLNAEGRLMSSFWPSLTTVNSFRKHPACRTSRLGTLRPSVGALG